MSKIEELMQQLCSNGVKYRKLGDFFSVLRGKRLTKNLLKNLGKYPVYHGGLEPLGYFDMNNRDAHTVMIINVGASAGTVGYSEEEFWSSDGCFCLSHNEQIDAKFLYHLLKANEFYLISHVRKAGIPTLDSKPILNMNIPIPPIEVQQEIVRLLDEYTESKDILLEKLKRELELRKKQYEHYREKLLSFEGKDVEWKPIEDIAYYPNKHIPINEINLYVGVENLLKDKKGVCKAEITTSSNNAIEFLEGDILVGNIRPYLKKIWHSDCRGGTNGDVVLLRIKEAKKNLCNNRFLYFLISSDKFFDYANQNSKGGKMPRGDKSKISQYKIPIPSLAEQERIVSILEQYEEVSGKLIEKLNQEIIQVQQQYEYYRDELLTF